TPAAYVVFDLIVSSDGKSLVESPLKERRRRLEKFMRDFAVNRSGVLLSPATTDIRQARKWLSMAGGGLDGIVAKRLDAAYRSGERTGMQKVKVIRTADCVVGGFRYASGKRVVGSLLLGLYDDGGKLHHVGFTSGISARERGPLTKRLEALVSPPGFTGKAPGGPSRWSTERSAEWKPLAPKLVAEVRYDSFSGGRFRHGTGFLRWRPDKKPRACTLDQVELSRRSVPISFARLRT
ncbi:MAG: ATP-dependent DNA ligase, partial [Thermoanaerobaculia bacterium]